MHRLHAMPYGAVPLPGGGCRFRLWAPAAGQVELCLHGEEGVAVSAMQAGPDGWFTLDHPGISAGARYRYRIDGDSEVPDPASRFQPEDVHGPSEVIDPAAWHWSDGDWMGRPWHETVLYELHVGTFSPEGDFGGVAARLDHLADLGITALELMPLADFPGRRNWGYDGVLPFAPDSSYGRPEELKALVEAAHARGLMVFLDVVYNHFGPEGNYLHRYAPDFFTSRHRTPWGEAIDFDGPHSAAVRDFFIHNALYWLEEYHIDGLRLDAVHAIHDDSHPDILEALAGAVRAWQPAGRHIHLVLENDHNAAHYLRPGAGYEAQWNDDFHHAAHVAATGEGGGYYLDYAEAPARHLARCLAEGFAYQGEPSAYRNGASRGESTAGLSPLAFVNFLQNHDQIGNRAFGERLTDLAEPEAVHALTAVLLLAPAPPLLFMGEEWGAGTPFLYFGDFGSDLAAAVTEGRRREFARFAEFQDPAARALIPDPEDPATFSASKLAWEQRDRPEGTEWLALHRLLLRRRHKSVIPRLATLRAGEAAPFGGHGIGAQWDFGENGILRMRANLGFTPLQVPPVAGAVLYATPDATAEGAVLPPWGVIWTLAP